MAMRLSIFAIFGLVGLAVWTLNGVVMTVVNFDIKPSVQELEADRDLQENIKSDYFKAGREILKCYAWFGIFVGVMVCYNFLSHPQHEYFMRLPSPAQGIRGPTIAQAESTTFALIWGFAIGVLLIFAANNEQFQTEHIILRPTLVRAIFSVFQAVISTVAIRPIASFIVGLFYREVII